MATMSDLFGGSTEDKRPKPPKWNNVGDHHDLVVTSDPVVEQQKDVGGSWEPLWLEKQDDGWKPVIESKLDESREHYKLTQIVVLGTLHATGEESVFYFDNKTKKAALKDAMEKTPLSVGYAIRMTRTPNVGRAHGWMVQIAPPKEDA